MSKSRIQGHTHCFLWPQRHGSTRFCARGRKLWTNTSTKCSWLDLMNKEWFLGEQELDPAKRQCSGTYSSRNPRVSGRKTVCSPRTPSIRTRTSTVQPLTIYKTEKCPQKFTFQGCRGHQIAHDQRHENHQVGRLQMVFWGLKGEKVGALLTAGWITLKGESTVFCHFRKH